MKLQAALDCLKGDRPNLFADRAAPSAVKIEPEAAQRKTIAAAIDREIAIRADELRWRGIRNPVTQAEKEAAERWHHASGAALNRWLRRNR